MVLRRIGPLSCAKVSGALYAVLGLLAGSFFALVSLIGAGFSAAERPDGALFGALFGVGALVLLPLFYGVLGFLGALLAAVLYNVLAGVVGGVELDLH
jgi:hypothetical protein